MDFNVMNILFDCAVILLATKICGMVTRKIGLPQVVGMIIAGLLIGPAIFSRLGLGFSGIINPTETEMDVLQSFSQIGVIFILFSSGLETDIKELKRSGAAATAVAAAGVLVPTALGTVVSLMFMGGLSEASNHGKLLNALFIGTILAATSVGITVETLRELGK
ncbi:MAG: cation:proton antiporter, partial [Acutalibacteraceae bacterium]